MSTHVQDIKERLGIADVVGSYIKLEKSGANYKARCPFHNEKTPSFYVSPDRGTFYCFGCQAKGDIFSFVEKFEGLDFMGSLKVLAERAGVVLSRNDAGKDNRKELLYEILDKATDFFEGNLKANPAPHQYLVGRGLTEETITRFRIGFAPAEWRLLRNFLKSKGYRDADVEAVGLIKKTDKPGADPYYDAFRGRIVFPISDSSGRVVAFTGRTLDEVANPPKYLNSPETVLFTKSKVLYGLDKAKIDIRKRDYAILVEGQMDLVMLHQAGHTNAVAASGTAFTEDTGPDSALGLLTRLSDNIVVAFDSDSAGQKAAKRIVPALSLMSAISLGMNVKIIDIKGGKDPADIIKEDPKAWVKMMETKKHFIEFLVDALVDKKGTPAEIVKLVNQDIFPFVRRIPGDTQKFQAIKLVADGLALNEGALWKDLQEYVRKNPSERPAASPPTEAKVKVNRLESIERKLIGILNSKKYLKGDESQRQRLAAVVGPERMSVIDRLSPEDIAELTLEAEVTYGDEGRFEREYSVLLLHLEEEFLRKRLNDRMMELQRAEKSPDKAMVEGLMRDIQSISKRIYEVKQLTTAL
ncbi:MAG: DNA primase [Candidatus Paceibacterota bacterium]|jgi:DNA primase